MGESRLPPSVPGAQLARAIRQRQQEKGKHMTNVPTGLSHQIALSGFLKHMGFRLLEDDDLDFSAKLDFVVAKVPLSSLFRRGPL